MSTERYHHAQWLELSGLPALLNELRAYGWPVFKQIVELDCARHRTPAAVEVTIDELGERVGLEPDKVTKVLEALRRKKYVRCFLPDSSADLALIEIRTPVQTPRSPEEVARLNPDPHMRDPQLYRYARAQDEMPVDERRVQEIVDYYLNTLSQKMNTVILEQIEIAARRFPAEQVRLTIDRAARHEIRNMTWVLKELIRDQQKNKQQN